MKETEFAGSRRLLLHELRRSGAMTRAELVKRTDLTILTVQTKINELLASGICREYGKQASAAGRWAVKIGLNPDLGYALAMDIGAAGIKLAAVDLGGAVLCRKFVHPLDDAMPARYESPEKLASRLAAIMKSQSGRCLGLGIGISGAVDAKNGKVEFCPNISGWDGFEACSFFSSRLGVDTLLDTSARCMALGEYRNGDEKNAESLLFVSLGACSVASGMILNGGLYRGADGSAGELGHVCVDPDGGKCTCGRRGCLELYATLPMVIDRAAGRGCSATTTEQLRIAYTTGDAVARRCVDEAARTVGRALSNAVNLLNPGAIVLGGGFVLDFPEMAEIISEEIHAGAMRTALKKLTVSITSLGADCAAAGCAMQIIDRFFE